MKKSLILILFYVISLGPTNAQSNTFLIPYRDGILWGYCDSTQKIIIEPQFQSATFFYRDTAIVMLNGVKGSINRNGQFTREQVDDSYKINRIKGRHWVVDNAFKKYSSRYDSVKFHSDSSRIVYKKGKGGIVSLKNVILYPIKCDRIYVSGEGMTIIVENGKYGFINSNYKVAVEPKYDGAEPFSTANKGYTFIYVGKLKGVINKAGVEYFK